MRLQKQLIARRTAMIKNISSILGAAGFALAIAVCLLAATAPGKAARFASDWRGACSGDAFRFCSGSMPGILVIAGSIRKNAQA
jgi:hypothetical protein